MFYLSKWSCSICSLMCSRYVSFYPQPQRALCGSLQIINTTLLCRRWCLLNVQIYMSSTLTWPTRDLGLITGLGRSPGEGKGYPLHYSGLENSMHRGAWQAVVLEKILESPWGCKIKPVHPKENQSSIFIRRTNAEAKAPIIWPPDVKNWLFGKDPDAGKDWR